MTYNYSELVREIDSVCNQHPEVGQVLYNEYSLDSTGDVCYPVIAITPNPVTVGLNITVYSFNLLYADRLTDERDNVVQAQSAGMDVITEIVNAMRTVLNMDVQDDLLISVYTGQFADQVAGCVATVNFVLPSSVGLCEWFKFEPLCNTND